MVSPQDEAAPTGGRAASIISNAVVAVYREYTGRGPTRARTTIADQHVAVVLEDTLLKAERSLIADGQQDAVRLMRRRFQDTMQDELVAAVEGATGQRVRAFMSDAHLEPDCAVEFFLLEPSEATP